MRTVLGVVGLGCLASGALFWGCAEECEAGRTTACACAQGFTGVQTCSDEGTWSDCSCVGGGGSGGSTTTSSNTGGSTSTGTGGSGGSCVAPNELCGGECVNTDTDPDHCGECSQSCPSAASCVAGECDCPGNEIVCGDECLDVSDDASNCGGCGHSCGADACTNGFCPVTEVATALQEPYALAVDATHVYWFTHTTPLPQIWRRTLALGTPEMVADAGLAPRDLALAGTKLFWTDYGTTGGDNAKVWKADLSGALPATPTQLVPELPSGTPEPAGLWGVAYDGAFVYYANQNDQTVRRVSEAGGASQSIAALEPTPWDVAVNASHVYWSNYLGGAVRRQATAGGADQDVATAQTGPLGMALTNTHVYWAAEGAHAIRRAPLGGGTVEDIATGQSSPTYVAVDDEFVYWTNYASGTVAKAPLAGGPVTVLAQNQANPYYVAVDATHCYWTTIAAKTPNGKVLRVAK